MKDKKTIYRKILRYIESMENYTKNITLENFLENTMISSACAFELCQIAELVNKLSEEEKNKSKNIPWNAIKGIRNHIIHNYGKFETEVLYQVITTDLPKLKKDLEKLI